MSINPVSKSYFGDLAPMNKMEKRGAALSSIAQQAAHYREQHPPESFIKHKNLKAIALLTLIKIASPLLAVIDRIGVVVRLIGTKTDPIASKRWTLYKTSEIAKKELEGITDYFSSRFVSKTLMGFGFTLDEHIDLSTKFFSKIEVSTAEELKSELSLIQNAMAHFIFLQASFKHVENPTLENFEKKTEELKLTGIKILAYFQKAREILTPNRHYSIRVDSLSKLEKLDAATLTADHFEYSTQSLLFYSALPKTYSICLDILKLCWEPNKPLKRDQSLIIQRPNFVKEFKELPDQTIESNVDKNLQQNFDDAKTNIERLQGQIQAFKDFETKRTATESLA
jgi:hypothetical protein